MQIVVTGGAGFLGSLLIHELLAPSQSGAADITEIICLDRQPSSCDDPRVVSVTSDLSDSTQLREVTARADAIYHLAAVVSAQAEAEFDLGLAVNIDATRSLLEAARSHGRCPRFVFSSSLAVFGGDLPKTVPAGFATHPRSSYGMEKAVAELLVAEYSRRGFIDGISVRLPTVTVRPGRPNAAASSFISGIVREPLGGETSNCPVPLDTPLWVSSPRTVVINLAQALKVDLASVKFPAIDLPGITTSPSEILDALEDVGGVEARSRVTFEEDENVSAIVCSWPGAFDTSSAIELGFVGDQNMHSIVEQYAQVREP